MLRETHIVESKMLVCILGWERKYLPTNKAKSIHMCYSDDQVYNRATTPSDFVYFRYPLGCAVEGNDEHRDIPIWGIAVLYD